MLKATYRKYNLKFINPGKTSRGIMYDRISWFLILQDSENPSRIGIGECAPLPGLSRDNMAEIEKKINYVCKHVNDENLILQPDLWNYPSILFGLETAICELRMDGNHWLFDTSFYNQQSSIPINGLIWMGSIENMLEQVAKKIKAGFHCIKIKIGAEEIQKEINLIRKIRSLYGWDIEIRVDANGAFTADSCIPVLNELASLKIHSIEQPLPSRQLDATAKLCENSPIPIALDEDIVHWSNRSEKINLLRTVKPAYIVLKPGLIGGFGETKQWIEMAESLGIGWWITSALESNLGLNAIAQYTSQWSLNLYQGLGTGQVFSNNLESPLYVEKGSLFYDPTKDWDLKPLGL